ncbi:hypothetical protein ACKWTF_005933 [Chironomus riparius]
MIYRPFYLFKHLQILCLPYQNDNNGNKIIILIEIVQFFLGNWRDMEPKEESNFKTQVYTAFCVNLLAIAYGNSFGWISPALDLLKTDATPLPSGPLSDYDIGIVGSASSFGGCLTSFFYGWIADKIGRKRALISIAIPQVIAWFLIYFGQNAYYLIAARFLQGFSGGGVYIVIPLFLTEISEDRIRGRLGSLMVLSVNIGMIMAYITGAYINYHWNCIILLIVPLIFFICVSVIHESPIYLMENGKSKHAENALKFYRSGFSYKQAEMSNKLKNEYDNMTAYIKSAHLEGDSKLTLSDFTTRPARKSIIAAMALMVFEIFTGTYALLSYASLVFDESGSTLSPNDSAIIVGVIQVVGVYVSTLLVDRAGRKLLMVTSAACCTIGLSVFCVYDYMKVIGIDVSDFNFIPLLSFAFVIFFANLGLVSLPFLIITELTPMKIKSTVYSFALVFSWGLAFLTIYVSLLLPFTLRIFTFY